MKNYVKKTIYVILSIILLLVISVFSIPYFFKDTIKQKVSHEIEKNVNADVYFDADQFGLSMISSFPDFTVSIGDFGVVGHEPFKGDTLINVNEFRLVVDIMSVISGDQIRVKEFYLNKPDIYAHVLKSGKANWDIYKGSSDTTQEEVKKKESNTGSANDTASSQFSLGVDEWKINKGNIIYHDETMPLYTSIKGLDHKGKGDFTQDVLDLHTVTDIKSLLFSFDSVTYMDNKSLHADMTMNLDLVNSKYTFKENEFRINDFAFGFDGFLAMPDTNIKMDITYEAKKTAFKNILSLVPGVYTKSFEKLKTSGKLAFNGFFKGIYNADQYPDFDLNLKVKNGMFQYPDLPSAVNDVNLDLKVNNDKGVIDSTRVNLKKLSLKLGKNPVKARMLLKRLDKYDMEGALMAEVDLSDISKMLPMEGMSLKGQLNADAKARGVVSEENLPQIKADINLKNGFFNSKDLPVPVENINFKSRILNSTGLMKDMEVFLDQFDMVLDEDKFTASGSVKNFNDYTYDMNMKGTIDLAKIMGLYPIEGMDLKGIINADITTAGKMSYIEKEQYQKLNTKGNLKAKNIVYSSEYMTRDLKINKAALNFNPQNISLTNYTGSIGSSNMNLSGKVSNYMGYIFKDHTISGNMDFRSNKVNINEFMAEDESSQTNEKSTKDTADAQKSEGEEDGAIAIPKNIDFVLNARIDQVIYSNMTMNKMKGDIKIKNGILDLSDLNFDMLDGHFVTNGTYNTKNPDQPSYDFDLSIKDLSIPKAYETFNTIKKFAPAAENMKGNFSSDFSLKGLIGPDMMPVYKTMDGKGMINIHDATYEGSPLLKGVASMTKNDKLRKLQLKDTKIQAEIKDGKVFVEPFNIKAGNTKMEIFGNNSLDGTMDYNIKVNMPSGKAGKLASNAISSFSGMDFGSVSRVNVDLKATGPTNDPDIKVVGISPAGGKGNESAKDKVVKKAKEEFEKKKKEAEEKAKEKTKEKAEKLKKESKQKAKKKTEDIKEKAKEKAGKKAKEKAKDVKDKFGF